LTNNFWQSEKITLDSYPRGFHLITQQVESALPSIRHVEVGLLHLWLQHTSASLTINENADPTVRHDMEAFFNHSVKEELSFFRHTYEGKDDMPAHLKSSILGCQLTIPVQQGKLALGTTPRSWWKTNNYCHITRDRSLTHIINGTICAYIKR